MALIVILFVLCSACTFVYLIPLVIFKLSRPLQRALLFMNHADTQVMKSDLARPEQFGLKCSRALRLEHPNILSGKDSRHKLIQLGAWHIPPASKTRHVSGDGSSGSGGRGRGRGDENDVDLGDEKAAFEDTRPIVLYLHGNKGNRATDYRCALYKRLAERLDYHVVTFDYRSFGDSTHETPSTFGLTSDARLMYDWLLEQPYVTNDRLVVWGHSLGAAVAVRMVADLARERQPHRVVLEAPFDSLANALANHPWARFHRQLPCFDYFIVQPIERTPELNFDSLERIGSIKVSPTLIMHAEDDPTIGHRLGFNLYEEALRRLGESKVKFLSLSAAYKLGHKHVGNHDESMRAVQQFIQETQG